MMNASGTVEFNFDDSCNGCFQSSCCRGGGEQRYWVNSKGVLEPWSPRKADVLAMEIAHARFVGEVERRIVDLKLDKGLVIAQLGLDLHKPEPVTKSLVERISEALAGIVRGSEAHPKPPK